VEAPEKVIAAHLLEQLVCVAQRADVVAGGEVFCILALQVAPEIQIAEDELVVLLSPPE